MEPAQRALVIAKISRIFPQRQTSEVLEILDRYGLSEHERERERVQLAILKLCDEDGKGDPAAYVETAKKDYRDVLAWAEYPNQMKASPNVDGERRAALVALDRAQYLAWLREI